MAKIKTTGLFTAAMSWLLMGYVGWNFTADPWAILRDLWSFLTGTSSYAPAETATFLAIIPFVFLIVALSFPISILFGVISSVVCGRPVSNTVTDEYRQVAEGPFFRVLFIVIFLEEVVFRWFLIGCGSKLSLFSGTAGFYVLLILANALFAYVHLKNFSDPKERQWPRVLPQFFGGLFHSFVFVKYGLLASVFSHFAKNSISFSMHKLQKTNAIDLIRIVVYAAYALAAWHFMNKPVSDALQWFSMEPTFALASWTIRDYLAFNVFFTSCFAILADLLLFDKNLSKKPDESPSLIGIAITIPIFICILLCVQYGVYWIASLFVNDFVLSVLIVATMMSMLSKNPSLSAAQRTFWVGIPSAFLTICTIQALGFKGAFLFMMIAVVISIPQLILDYMDD